MKNEVTRKIGKGRGKARIWLEGQVLKSAGWVKGVRYNRRFKNGKIIYEVDEGGRLKVSGTNVRPIIDTNTDKIRGSVGDKSETVNISITATKIIVAGAALIAAALLPYVARFAPNAQRVLVACEFSGAVRDAILANGHDAVSCDLLATDKAGPHITGDALGVLDKGWDALLAFPPCTHLCSSGARWLTGHWVFSKAKGTDWIEKNGERLRAYWHDGSEKRRQQKEAIEFFMAIANASIPKIAIENPIGRMSSAWRKPDQIVQPWMFGHGETKATCLWLKGLPKLTATNIVEGRKQNIFLMPPSADRWKLRSLTFPGIAGAMANQWFGRCS